MKPPPRERLVAVTGVIVGALMILMKIVPSIPGSFSPYEWLALGIWATVGLALGLRQRTLNRGGAIS